MQTDAISSLHSVKYSGLIALLADSFTMLVTICAQQVLALIDKQLHDDRYYGL